MDSEMLARFVALERGVWKALVDGDGAADSALLSEDFLGVYETGFSDRAEHAAMLDDGPIVARYKIEDARLRIIGDAAVLLAYRAIYTRPGAPDQEECMYVSSLWEEIDGRWVNTFSQDTNAA